MKELIRETAKKLGFAAVGITTAEPVAAAAFLREAIDAGRIGAMAWLGRDPEARCDPRSLFPGARSVICCALPYGDNGLDVRWSDGPMVRWKQSSVPSDYRTDGLTDCLGGVQENRARFARGAEYHEAVRLRLEALWEAIRAQAPDARVKICCDTSPILEKALAARAGLGWIGRHTVLVNRDMGSFFVLGEVITDLEIEPDPPHAEDLCGECRKCIDACPTQALVAPGELDARRCISYLSIEHGATGARGDAAPVKKSIVPSRTDHRSPITDHESRHSYGCDLCQEACPYNRG